MKLLRHILVILAVTILLYLLWGKFFGTSPGVSDLISDRSTEFVDEEPFTVSVLGTPR